MANELSCVATITITTTETMWMLIRLVSRIGQNKWREFEGTDWGAASRGAFRIAHFESPEEFAAGRRTGPNSRQAVSCWKVLSSDTRN